MATTVDVNAIQAPQTPITVEFSGSLGPIAIGQGDGFREDLSARLSASSLVPDSLSVTFPLFSSSFSGQVIVRTNSQVKNGAGVLYLVRQAILGASGHDATAATVIAIGNPGDVVTPAGPPSVFDPFKAITDWFKSLSDTLQHALQVIIWILAIGLIVYVLVTTGALKAGREAFA